MAVSTTTDPAQAPPHQTPKLRRLSPRARKAVLTAHVVVSVGLLGDSAGFLAVAIRAATTSDAAAAAESLKVLQMFSVVFGIPLSVAAIVTGMALGLGTRWGVFRYPWVAAKLALIVSVMAVGATVIGPSLERALDGAGGEGALVAAACWDVLALGLATALSVFKPGGRFRRAAAPQA